MTKTIVCGKENLNGKLIPAPLDGKNVTTDWIEDFLFEGNCAKAQADARYCGFASLTFDNMGEMLTDVWIYNEYVEYIFPCCTYIDESEIDYFCDFAKEYFKENEFTLVVGATRRTEDIKTFKPEIRLYFNFRDEVETA